MVGVGIIKIDIGLRTACVGRCHRQDRARGEMAETIVSDVREPLEGIILKAKTIQ